MYAFEKPRFKIFHYSFAEQTTDGTAKEGLLNTYTQVV
jgi:hypothetical protein